MIALHEGNKHFMLRTAAILIHEQKVLLQKAKRPGAWVLPGGKAEIFERSEDTLHRELKEELGVEAHVGRLVAVIENFHAYGAEGLHELGLYYVAELDPVSPVQEMEGEFAGKDEQVELYFQWHPIEEITHLELYPKVLRELLPNLPDRLSHYVNQDRDWYSKLH